MPKRDAVSNRNWAITVQLPAANSWCSSMMSAVNAKHTAAMNDATATPFSANLFCGACIIIDFEKRGSRGFPGLPPELYNLKPYGVLLITSHWGVSTAGLLGGWGDVDATFNVAALENER